MSPLLEASRISVPLLPERFIVESARAEGIELDALEPVIVRPAEPELNRRVLGGAIRRWRDQAPSWTRLNFTMQPQEQTEWCWAATTVSVRSHYDPQTSWTQCAMVNAEKGLDVCCQDGSSDACNQPNVLDSPLDRAEVLDHKESAPVSYDSIRNEIDAGRPLAWRIGWIGGGGHFAVIEGYQRVGDEWVAVDDPWYGASDVPVSSLTGGAYKRSGSWTHSYFTRPPLPVPSLVRAEDARAVRTGERP